MSNICKLQKTSQTIINLHIVTSCCLIFGGEVVDSSVLACMLRCEQPALHLEKSTVFHGKNRDFKNGRLTGRR